MKTILILFLTSLSAVAQIALTGSASLSGTIGIHTVTNAAPADYKIDHIYLSTSDITTAP